MSNLALGWWAFSQPSLVDDHHPAPPDRIENEAAYAARKKARAQTLMRVAVQAAAVPKLSRSPDYAGLARDLRGAEYPRRVIRQAIGRMMEDDFDRAIVQLLGPERARNYFARGERTLDRADLASVLALRVRVDSQRRDALGDDLLNLDSPRNFRAWERGLGAAMTWEKYAEVLRQREDYALIHESIHATMAPPAEEQRLHAYADAQERNDLETLLTPTERDEWDLRNSGTANRVKSQLRGREVTEAEFRRRFREQRAADQNAGVYPH